MQGSHTPSAGFYPKGGKGGAGPGGRRPGERPRPRGPLVAGVPAVPAPAGRVLHAGRFHRAEGEVAYRCPNGATCPAQVMGFLIHWSGRDAFDIEGLGEAAVEQLVERGLVRGAADLYRLRKEDLLTLELFADKKADNLLAQIEASKTKPLARLLYALGIRHVGEKLSRVLAHRFGSLDALMGADAESLCRTEEVGEVVARSIRTFFDDPRSRALLAQLKKAGIDPREEPPKPKSGPFFGKVVVFTGELSSLARRQAQDLVRELGGEAVPEVTRAANLVVAGETPGSKLKKARKAGIEIIDEKESGVNNAVALADEYFLNEGFDATVVFPQDIPLIQPADIQALFNFKNSQKCALVVPSRKFDGTNALFRSPVNLMKTHYDEDSYKIHLSTAEETSASSALVLIRRIMLDVDEMSDLQFISNYIKPSISKIIQDL